MKEDNEQSFHLTAAPVFRRPKATPVLSSSLHRLFWVVSVAALQLLLLPLSSPGFSCRGRYGITDALGIRKKKREKSTATAL
jgi:hypothetical protein